MPSCRCAVDVSSDLSWFAVEELKLSYHDVDPLLFTLRTVDGRNLAPP